MLVCGGLKKEAQTIKVVVNTTDGDYAPARIVRGAVEAAKEKMQIQVILVGQEDIIKKGLEKQDYPRDRVSVVHTSGVIETGEPPVSAIRKKKDPSIVVGMDAVGKQEADAFISAGSSRAALVGGRVIVGRIGGVERPPLVPLIPTKTSMSLLADCGASVDARTSYPVQFARMGSIYVGHIIGVKHPRVAIMNIGAEEERGNVLVKGISPLLRECKDINFVGSIEAREMPHGGMDMIVCEAFAGSIILKLYGGVGATLINEVKGGMMMDLRSRIDALLVEPAPKKALKVFNVSQYGDAPFLGSNNLVVKTHGDSKAVEVKSSIVQRITLKKQGINKKMGESLKPKGAGQENREAQRETKGIKEFRKF